MRGATLQRQMPVAAAEVFALLHDYERRLEWDSLLKEARLSVRGDDGLSEQIVRQGDWALLRLIDDATVVRKGSWYRMEWTLKEGTIRVQMEFKPQRSDNPLMLQRLLRGGTRCPRG